jgi:hypothetical protein
LSAVLAKTLVYGSAGSGKRAVFAADLHFDPDADYALGGMPGDWEVARISLSEELASSPEDGVDQAKRKLLDALQEEPGVALAGYIGHSSRTSWNPGLFTSADARDLVGSPTVVAQFGCWNTYFASPLSGTLAKDLLAGNPSSGAAAVIGASTLTSRRNEKAFAKILFAEGGLVDGKTPIGFAIKQAKERLAEEMPYALDILLGYQLIGDPTLIVGGEDGN